MNRTEINELGEFGIIDKIKSNFKKKKSSGKVAKLFMWSKVKRSTNTHGVAPRRPVTDRVAPSRTSGRRWTGEQ